MSEPITYGEWGVDFFRTAVTEERIGVAVNALAGRPIEFGPLGVGPGRLAQVTAHGEIQKPRFEQVPGDLVAFRLIVPAHVDFELSLKVDRQRYSADVEIPLMLTVHAYPELRLVVDIVPPEPDQVKVKVRGESLRAAFVSAAADIEGEFRRFVAKYVAREIEKPEIVAARTIDVGARIDAGWQG